MTSSPIAFMSYSHIDDQNDHEYLRRLCENLSKEIRVQTGNEFNIFFDRNDIKWGQNWEERIDESIDTTTFFIPLITPNFFKSDYCRSELKRFIKRQEELGRKDLILPIYYVEYSLLNDDDLEKEDELAFAITTHQWADWRDFRFSDIHSQKVRRAITGLAKQIKDSLERTKQVELGRKKGGNFTIPRNIESGDEQKPLPNFLQIKQTEPRKLLEVALQKKQSGDYGAAKESLLKLIQLGINWDKYIDLFVDLLYFSISTYDKLEEWHEIDYLEKYYIIPTSEKIKGVITDNAYQPIQLAYQSEMALVMLRQTRLDDAYIRIDEAIKNCPRSKEEDAFQILYANALTTRALILHAIWGYKNGSASFLRDASNDLREAEDLYRKYARMEQPDEFHHLGRFYGIQSFLYIALSESGLQPELQIPKLLLFSNRAHKGNNRTAYGKISGKYCDAFCNYKVSTLQSKPEKKLSYLLTSYNLLREARNSAIQYLGAGSALTHVKILGLLIEIGKELSALQYPIDNNDYILACNSAKESLRNRGYSFLESIPFTSWLSTPLN